MGDCTGMMGTKICSIHGLIILKRWKTTPLMMTTSYPFVAVWSVTITVITQDPLCRTNQQIKGTTPLFDPEPQDYTLAYTQYIYIHEYIIFRSIRSLRLSLKTPFEDGSQDLGYPFSPFLSLFISMTDVEDVFKLYKYLSEAFLLASSKVPILGFKPRSLIIIPHSFLLRATGMGCWSQN
jgi:hypothetical protein